MLISVSHNWQISQTRTPCNSWGLNIFQIFQAHMTIAQMARTLPGPPHNTSKIKVSSISSWFHVTQAKQCPKNSDTSDPSCHPQSGHHISCLLLVSATLNYHDYNFQDNSCSVISPRFWLPKVIFCAIGFCAVFPEVFHVIHKIAFLLSYVTTILVLSILNC